MKKLLSKKVLIGIVIIAVLGISGYFYNEFASQVSVDLHTIDQGTVVESVLEDGYIEAVKTAEVQVSVNGVIKETLAEVGDQVSSGDVLIKLDDDVILLQIEQVESEIRAMDAQLLEASKPADQELIRNASLAVSISRDTRNKAKDDYDKNLTLYASGAVSKQALDASEKVYQDAQNNYNKAINESKLVNKGISDHLKNQYHAQIDALYAQKKILERQMSDYLVASPMTGVVLSKASKAGHFVMTGQTLYEIAELNNLKLVCEILEEDYSKITLETPVTLHDKNKNTYYEAYISKIYPRSESRVSDLGIKQNRVKVEVMPVDGLTGYIIGQEMDVNFITSQVTNTRVPIDSVYKSSGKSYVFLVKDGQLLSREIKLGLEGEDYFEVIEGLDKDEEVVKVITNELKEGQKVKQ